MVADDLQISYEQRRGDGGLAHRKGEARSQVANLA